MPTEIGIEHIGAATIKEGDPDDNTYPFVKGRVTISVTDQELARFNNNETLQVTLKVQHTSTDGKDLDKHVWIKQAGREEDFFDVTKDITVDVSKSDLVKFKNKATGIESWSIKFDFQVDIKKDDDHKDADFETFNVIVKGFTGADAKSAKEVTTTFTILDDDEPPAQDRADAIPDNDNEIPINGTPGGFSLDGEDEGAGQGFLYGDFGTPVRTFTLPNGLNGDLTKSDIAGNEVETQSRTDGFVLGSLSGPKSLTFSTPATVDASSVQRSEATNQSGLSGREAPMITALNRQADLIDIFIFDNMDDEKDDDAPFSILGFSDTGAGSAFNNGARPAEPDGSGFEGLSLEPYDLVALEMQIAGKTGADELFGTF